MQPITSIHQLDPTAKYSYRDYLTWQFSDMVELIEGRVQKMSPAPLSQHQIVVINIASSLRQYLRRKLCRVFVAPFDVRLPHLGEIADEQIFTTVQPDICIVCDRSKIDRRGCLGVPDMVVEVLSPGNTAYDTGEKYRLYEEFGVQEYWIVSPGEQNVAVYHLRDGTYALHAEYAEAGDISVATLPGFSLEWSEIFE